MDLRGRVEVLRDNKKYRWISICLVLLIIRYISPLTSITSESVLIEIDNFAETHVTSSSDYDSSTSGEDISIPYVEYLPTATHTNEAEGEHSIMTEVPYPTIEHLPIATHFVD